MKTGRLICSIVLLALPAFSQLVLTNGSAVVGPSLVLPSVTPGDTLDTTLTLTNNGASSVTVSKLALGGSGFSLRDYPALPVVLAAGQSLSFTLRFMPPQIGSYSASIIAGSISFFVLAKATYGPTLYYADATGTLQPVIDSQGVDLGPVQQGLQLTTKFTLQNNNLQSVTVNKISVSGDFQLSQAVATPFTLTSGQPSTFAVISVPGAGSGGTLSGTLAIDSKTIPLRAHIVAPILPKPTISFSTATFSSAEQVEVTINLDSASPVAGTGTLQVVLQNGPAGVPPDGGMIFPATGSAQASFTVSPGESIGRFSGQPSITFQTGTTYGAILFTATLGGIEQNGTITIAQAPVSLTSVHATRAATGLQVELIGFDNTRTAGSVAFTFYDLAGNTLGSTFTVTLASQFQTYFQTSNVGGLFDLKAVFPVTSGSINLVDSVDVRIANGLSATSAPRAKF